jgi:hypothetical protein
MVRRHADYLKNGDNVRAGLMAEFLETAGIPAAELAQHFATKSSLILGRAKASPCLAFYGSRLPTVNRTNLRPSVAPHP